MYEWPFNVRELAQFVRRVVALYPEADVLEANVFMLPGETTADLGAPDRRDQLPRKRVDDARAHAVEATCRLVVLAFEFAAGMELGEHHLHS